MEIKFFSTSIEKKAVFDINHDFHWDRLHRTGPSCIIKVRESQSFPEEPGSKPETGGKHDTGRLTGLHGFLVKDFFGFHTLHRKPVHLE